MRNNILVAAISEAWDRVRLRERRGRTGIGGFEDHCANDDHDQGISV
jgi:hypothetical protein